MSQGKQWIDAVMKPLSVTSTQVQKPSNARSNPYNRIYEAVGRGTEEQGRQLVQAILDYIAANQGSGHGSARH